MIAAFATAQKQRRNIRSFAVSAEQASGTQIHTTQKHSQSVGNLTWSPDHKVSQTRIESRVM